MNHYNTSDGQRLTQTQVASRLAASYKLKRMEENTVWCHGCGKPANGFAHIIAQARCKQLRKTELIWNSDNYFPACFECNSAIENPKSVLKWKNLKNINHCLEFIKKHDNELYMKFTLNAREEADR